MHHHAKLNFVFFVEMGFCHVGQSGLELLTSAASGDLPSSASQSVGITGVSHCTWSTSVRFLSNWHVLLCFLSCFAAGNAIHSRYVLGGHFTAEGGVCILKEDLGEDNM